MTDKETTSTAHQRRNEYRETLPSPQLPPSAIVDHTDGTLHRDALEADLPLSIPKWLSAPGPGEGQSQCDVMWAVVRADDPPLDEEYRVVDGKSVGPGEPFPLALMVPEADLGADGKHYLKIRVIHWNDTGIDFSPPIPVICDSRPPYRQEDPVPLEVPTEPVTDAWLAANGDTLTVGLPHYTDFQPRDRVVYYWGQTFPLAHVASVAVDDSDWPMPLEISGDLIRTTGAGLCYAQYELFDKATNRSRLSSPAAVEVVLGALPGGLQDPVLPLAADGLLELADAVKGVGVQIPAFSDYLPGDEVIVTWGDTELAPSPVGGSPAFPLEIPVPPGVLRETYGSGTGSVDTQVSYLVKRGSFSSEVKTITIAVDFSVIGPAPDPDADWPDPVNSALLPAEISGKVSNTPNVLTLEDYGEPATLAFTLYDPLNADETVSFHWSGTEVTEARYTVKSSDSPHEEVTVEIPWHYIEQTGNHVELPVHYRIGGPASPNRQHSPDTPVAVSTIEAPPAPTFQGLYNGRMLNCDSLYVDPDNPHPLEPAIRVEVPDLSQPPYSLKDGDIVTLHWIALAGQTGEAFLDATELEEQVTLDAEHPPSGFVWRVQPYATHILPTYDPVDPTNRVGRGRATYAFDQAGQPTVSIQAQALVAMATGTGSCDVPPRSKTARIKATAGNDARREDDPHRKGQLK